MPLFKRSPSPDEACAVRAIDSRIALRFMRATPTRLAPLPTLVLPAQLASPPSRAEAPKPDAAIQQVLRKAQGALRQLSKEAPSRQDEAGPAMPTEDGDGE